MGSYAILTNRKRALIALIHSFVFLGIAFRSVLRPSAVSALQNLNGAALKGSVAILGIYVIVTTILLQLARVSSKGFERLYFGLCATSAGFGIARYWLGDLALPAAIYVRVIALTLAVATGTLILLKYDRQQQRIANKSAA
jgi:hypothetical protein